MQEKKPRSKQQVEKAKTTAPKPAQQSRPTGRTAPKR